MRVAVIGAGIAGVTLAHDLAGAGHEVQVLERRASVAAEGSFALSGLLAPDLVQPWTATPLGGAPRGLPVQPALPWLQARSLGQAAWLWRAWQARRGAAGAAGRASLLELARWSQGQQRALVERLAPDFERAQGVLLLVRSARRARWAQDALARRPAEATPATWLEAEAARALEPALHPGAALAGAVHLPVDEAGNCRQYAHALKAHAQRLGARFRFGCEVLRLRPGRPVTLELGGGEVLQADAAVLCSGLDSRALLQPLGLRLPTRAVRTASVTAPLQGPQADAAVGPRHTLVDLDRQVILTPLGDRVRASGGARLQGADGSPAPDLLRHLHGTLAHWLAQGAATQRAQHWQGASLILPDGLPVLGPSGQDGLWLNLGHGAHGWVLASGAAAMLRALIEGSTPPVPAQPFAIGRLR